MALGQSEACWRHLLSPHSLSILPCAHRESNLYKSCQVLSNPHLHPKAHPAYKTLNPQISLPSTSSPSSFPINQQSWVLHTPPWTGNRILPIPKVQLPQGQTSDKPKARHTAQIANQILNPSLLHCPTCPAKQTRPMPQDQASCPRDCKKRCPKRSKRMSQTPSTTPAPAPIRPAMWA